MPSESWGGHAKAPIPRKSRGRSSEARTLTRLPLHPLLFAAYAVLFLYAQNLSEVLLVDIGAPLGRALLGAAVVLGLATLIYRDVQRGALLASALVIAYFAYGHVACGLGPGTTDRPRL